jgi:hypothetical protein
MMNLLSVLSIVTTLAFAGPTLHQTPNGKYPIYFEDVEGQDNGWNDTMQKEYDGKMDLTLSTLCKDNIQLGELEKSYIEADQKDGDQLNSHPEIGLKIKNVKAEIIKLSDIVVRGTGKNARDWGCP